MVDQLLQIVMLGKFGKKFVGCFVAVAVGCGLLQHMFIQFGQGGQSSRIQINILQGTAQVLIRANADESVEVITQVFNLQDLEDQIIDILRDILVISSFGFQVIDQILLTYDALCIQVQRFQHSFQVAISRCSHAPVQVPGPFQLVERSDHDQPVHICRCIVMGGSLFLEVTDELIHRADPGSCENQVLQHRSKVPVCFFCQTLPISLQFIFREFFGGQDCRRHGLPVLLSQGSRCRSVDDPHIPVTEISLPVGQFEFQQVLTGYRYIGIDKPPSINLIGFESVEPASVEDVNIQFGIPFKCQGDLDRIVRININECIPDPDLVHDPGGRFHQLFRLSEENRRGQRHFPLQVVIGDLKTPGCGFVSFTFSKQVVCTCCSGKGKGPGGRIGVSDGNGIPAGPVNEGDFYG